MKDIKEWDLETLLYTFFRVEYAIASTGSFSQRAGSTQYELLRLQNILNVFTDGEYDITTYKGREEIEEAFYSGFGKGKNFCTTEQINKLRELLPPQKYNFQQLKGVRPRVEQFYEPLFRMVQAGYKYLTLFDEMNCISDPFRIIKHFKETGLDTDVRKTNATLFEAIKILLGERFSKVIIED